MRRRIVTVNDKMQQGYRYVLSAPAGRDFDSEFWPDLTPNSPVKMSRFDQATSRVTATIRAAVSTSDAAMITKAIVSAA